MAFPSRSPTEAALGFEKDILGRMGEMFPNERPDADSPRARRAGTHGSIARNADGSSSKQIRPVSAEEGTNPYRDVRPML